MIRSYNEPAIVTRLAGLGRTQKTAFAAAAAQRLAPLFVRYAATTDDVEADAIGSIIHDVWRSVGGAETDLRPLQHVAEGLVPDEDDGWTIDAAYAQNAAASTAYAIRAWSTDDAQEAAWAARQLYEAADYAAQQILTPEVSGSDGLEQALLAHPLVQDALAAIEDALAFVERSSDFAELAERSTEGGLSWAGQMP